MPTAKHISTDVAGKRITVVGAARSGMAVSRLLSGAGAVVFVTDASVIDDERRDQLAEAGVAFEDGGHSRRALEADFLVTSPGVPDSAEIMLEATRTGLPVFSELEVAAWFCEAPIVAVTGSNGKTTTTSLIGHIFRSAGRTTHIAGNIGVPFSVVAAAARHDDIVVLEVSSFQLDHTYRFRPLVSVLLNITPDHLDRYGNNMSAYAASKLRICSNQQAGDAFVYNMDDAVVRSHINGFGLEGNGRSGTGLDKPGVERIGSGPSALKGSELEGIGREGGPTGYGFSLEARERAAGWLQDDKLMLRIGAKEEVLMQSKELALRGRHNVGNSLAAAITARIMEVKSDIVRSSLASFEGVPHRLEHVREVEDVQYINDSKATNVNAVWFALESMHQPVVLIAGGRDKGNDYGPLRELVASRVRILIAIGESAGKIEQDLGDLVETCVRMDSLADAVRYASLLAKPGETVLLSPACASFDMFDNYEDRGETFKRLVSEL